MVDLSYSRTTLPCDWRTGRKRLDWDEATWRRSSHARPVRPTRPRGDHHHPRGVPAALRREEASRARPLARPVLHGVPQGHQGGRKRHGGFGDEAGTGAGPRRPAREHDAAGGGVREQARVLLESLGGSALPGLLLVLVRHPFVAPTLPRDLAEDAV